MFEDSSSKLGLVAIILTSVVEIATLYFANKNNRTQYESQYQSTIMQELEYYRSESRELRGELTDARTRVSELEEFLDSIEFDLQEEQDDQNDQEAEISQDQETQ